ncbi:DoxX family protein [Nannocystis sp. ILAH1]|uniref:DoxX family protein n=1 Tax=unclassified Nannocystis TaxID=2627009 RepID=UPI0022721863|nr:MULTISPECIES: DoxX family protein [unclassified Nannocystis]MCY0993999.1 DoxX family protein [Nannocystis sp. ILAH1]MCY1066965.1 DoxX family protein [Nannocystis sp. RBIL2]
MSRLLPTVARSLLGLLFLVFGLNGFLNFLPMPPHPGRAGEFLGALAASGYMFPLIKGTEVVGGALLLSGRLVPLALVLLAPVIVNIVAFHLALEPGGYGMLAFIVGLEVYLAWAYRDSFAGVLNPNARPVASEHAAPQLARARA